MSAAVSIVPSSEVRPRDRRPKSARRQSHLASSWMRPAVDAALAAQPRIAAIDAGGKVAVLVYQPTASTLLSLARTLSVVQLAIVALMVLRVMPCVRVFGIVDGLFGTMLRPAHRQAPCIVYSGASMVPVVVRVAAVQP